MKRVFTTCLFTLSILLTTFNSDARNQRLEEPKPIKIKKSIDDDSIKEVIIGSLIQKDWTLEPVHIQPNSKKIIGTYHHDHKKIMVSISYKNNKISFKYHDSKWMKYDKKSKYSIIHADYMKWTKELAKQIKKNLKKVNTYNLESIKNELGSNFNPPPKTQLNQFSKFTIDPVSLAKSYQGHKGNVNTQKLLNENIIHVLNPVLESWSNDSSNGPTLVIKPKIKAVRFVGGGTRFLAGKFSGRSWLLVELNLVNSSTDDLISSPLLFNISVYTSSLSQGDKKMIEDMANDIKKFLVNNYEQSIGGGNHPKPSLLRKVKPE